MHQLKEPIYILGLELRTTNDHGQSFKDIPPFWEKFFKEGCITKIENKLADDIYGVYTDFENKGKNNQGMYSLIIGCPVAQNTVIPDGYKLIKIPAGNYLEFPVEKNRNDKVGEAWQKIWSIQDKQNWLFNCEFERYSANGDICILIGIK